MNQIQSQSHRRGFTLVELLVAIGIIMVLIGILLPALGKVSTKAKMTSTTATMNEFAKACDVFYTQFGYYPGIVPEAMLAATVNPPISGTENALLHLMGGAIRNDDPTYAASAGTEFTFGTTGTGQVKIKINAIDIGKGPRIEGKQYDPFFTPKDAQLKIAVGQVGQTLPLPDLLDAWGQPIGYIRSSRPTGLMTGTVAENPQFFIEPLFPYFNSTGLGDLAIDQTVNSVFYAGTNANKQEYLAQLIRHPAMGSFAVLGDAKAGTPRGKYFLFSAGSDGIYFAKLGDGPTPTATFTFAGADARKPDVVTTYNDIVVSGGG
ncbi:MAG: prepilin-type N-terminal cleavage/methylation domain-containing protein [Planctomycetota bacterium]